MPIMRTALYQIKPEAQASVLAAIVDFVAYIKANEPGTLRYTALQQSDDPTRFMHFMIFQDATAEQSHRASPGTRQFTSVLYPRTVDGVSFTSYTVAGSTETAPARQP